mmetsp:Transcript_10859/g.26635  ORF Transcript_10859/g.26635 Transcript_10859/m.26635 type:complete len:238 (+) Transcript_10859:917-1630(+)
MGTHTPATSPAPRIPPPPSCCSRTPAPALRRSTQSSSWSSRTSGAWSNASSSACRETVGRTPAVVDHPDSSLPSRASSPEADGPRHFFDERSSTPAPPPACGRKPSSSPKTRARCRSRVSSSRPSSAPAAPPRPSYYFAAPPARREPFRSPAAAPAHSGRACSRTWRSTLQLHHRLRPASPAACLAPDLDRPSRSPLSLSCETNGRSWETSASSKSGTGYPSSPDMPFPHADTATTE